MAVLTLLIVTSGVAIANAQGNPVLSVFASENEFAPGEDGELVLTLQNAGDVNYATSPDERARVTTARDVVVDISTDGAPIEIEGNDDTQPVGNLPEGISSPIGVSISVDQDAEPGTYELPVRVDYTYTRVVSRIGVHDGSDGRLRTDITIVIEDDDSNFRVVDASAPDLYRPGGPITVTLENEGPSTANDATLAIESGSADLSFNGDQTAETFIGDWAPGETRSVSIEGTLAPGADDRSYPLAATVTYENDAGDSRTSDRLTVGVSPQLESRFAIESVDSSLAVGEEGTVSGTLVNNGGSVARNVVLVLSADTRNFEPIETEYAIGNLEAGDTAAFTYDAEVSEAAAGGPRQLSFTVRYRDRSNEVVESEPLDARVDVGPERDRFSVEPISASLTAGGSGELRLEVTNEGEDTVTDISGKLFANAPLSTGDDEAFIDRLEPGASAEIVFGITAGGSALSKTYPVSLDFQYEADGDTRLSDTYQVPIAVTVPEDGDGGLPIPLLAGGLIALIVVAMGYYAIRHR